MQFCFCLLSCLMILYGLLTVHNINRSNRNHLAILRFRSSERQLSRMLIFQVSSHIILSLPFSVVFFMAMIPTPFKSAMMYVFLFIIFKIPFYIDFITPFFLYRRELIALFNKILGICRHVAIYPMGA